MLSPIKSTQQEETMALAAQNPLSGFIELNNQVFLYEPREPPLPPPAAGDRGPGRCLVIICAWLFAAPRHIAKYTRLYQARLPRADILLIRPVAGDMVWTADAAQIRRLEPAVVAIRRFLADPASASSSGTGQKKENKKKNREITLHAFSIGGSHAAVQLSEAFTKETRQQSQSLQQLQLPISCLILDSCPGLPSATLAANALILALPRSAILKGPRRRCDIPRRRGRHGPRRPGPLRERRLQNAPRAERSVGRLPAGVRPARVPVLQDGCDGAVAGCPGTRGGGEAGSPCYLYCYY